VASLMALGSSISLFSKPLQAQDLPKAQDYDISVLRKKSIYSQERPVENKAPTKTRLQVLVGDSISTINSNYKYAINEIEKNVDRFIEFEKNAIRVTKEIISNDEKFMPAALVISISTLTAPIITRKSNFILRNTLPLATFLATTSYFFPNTCSNAVNKLNSASPKFNSFSQNVILLKNQSQNSLNDINSKIVDQISSFKSKFN
ncbi:hypothetical protein AYI70_g8262, partial [Smittium culicis]